MACGSALGEPVIGTGFRRSVAPLVPFDMETAGLPSLVADLGADDRVYLLGALTHMDSVAEHPESAARLNVDATRRRIDEALERGAK